MAQANVPSGRPAQNHVAHTNGVSRPTRSNSAYADGNVPFVFPQDGPRRHTYSQQTGDYEPPNKQHSRINHRPEILARKASLREKLDAAEKRRDVRLCKRTKVDLSDSADQSPWARKVVLCLDGGGVKGYSSLLILKRLMGLVEEIEHGLRKSNNPDEISNYHVPHASSDDSPWDPLVDPRPPPPPPIDEDNEDIAQSIRDCLNRRQSDNFKVHHYFDYISGTSTGGLSAIMLGRLEMSVQKALDQYDLVGREVFGNPRFIHSTLGFANFIRPKYPSKNMEAAMISVIQNGLVDQPLYKQKSDEQKRKFAASLTFQSDPRRCRTTVLAHGPSDLNKDVKHTYVFRSFDHPHPSPWAPKIRRKGHRNPGSATSDKIWKVARATSAAPKYFSHIRFNDRTFLDGGMGANNPSEVTLAEVRQMHRHLPQVLLSIGTGLQKKKHRSHNHKKLVVAKGWRHVGKAMAYLVSQSQDTAERVYETCDSMDIPYVRWNAPGVGDVVLDEWQPPSTGELTKSKILTLTQQHLVDVHLRLVQYAKKLVEIRRRRAETERWEVFARQNVYFCPDPECHYNIAAQSFETREELREHGICAHSYITNVDIDNVENLNHACVHNECGHESIRVFPKQGDFEQHLLSDHGVKPDPVFMTPRRMEAWLDRGRMTQVQAFDRHDTEDQLKDSDKTAINGTSHHPNHDNFTNGTLRPPEVNETPQPTTPPRPTENGLGDGRVQSSKHSANAPSPARSATDTIAGASQESRERSGSVGQLRQQRTESPTPISRRSSGWQLPVTFRPLFKRTATDG